MMKAKNFSNARWAPAIMCLAVFGCGSVPQPAPPQIFATEFPDERSATIESASEIHALREAPTTTEPNNRLIYHQGVAGSLQAHTRSPAEAENQEIQLSFVNAPARDVARAIISETLGMTVAVADGVDGVVTLSAAGPVPAREALSALDAVLAESNLALIRRENDYLLARLQDAQGRTPRFSDSRGVVGYGVAFAPVRYAPASEIVSLIEPFLSSRLTVSADDERGAIILKGPQSDIATAQEAIETFDSPHLTDRVFGLFRLHYSDAAALREETLSILRASGGAASADILSLPRLNLLFVTARTRAGFDEVRRWIERLDQPSGGDERRLRYYPAQHTPAKILGDQLQAAFAFDPALVVDERAALPAPETAVQPGFRRRAQSDSRLSIVTDELNNALIIRATDREYQEIADLLQRMDVLSPQVLIEATIAEVALNESLNYGVRWFFENAESTLALSDNEAGRIAAAFPGFNYTYFDTDARVALSALSSVTDVTVLSAPSIMVINNQTAHLQVGDEVPIVTQQAQSVVDGDAPIVSTLQLRETGVILEVKPRINASGIVVLEISQEVSDVAPTTTSGIDSPTIQQRRFTSTVAVQNNGTIALGGLIRESYSDNQSGVPILKDIPVLGTAFKSREISKRRTELVVFLTPRIIRNSDDAHDAIRYIRREMTRLGAHRNHEN